MDAVFKLLLGRLCLRTIGRDDDAIRMFALLRFAGLWTKVLASQLMNFGAAA